MLALIGASCSKRDATAPSMTGAPEAIAVIGGNDQSALAGLPLPRPVAFKLADSFGNGIANTAIAFRVTAGEGLLAGGATTAITDQTGVAIAPAWTLGKIATAQQLTASVGNITTSANATVSTQFHAELRFFGTPVNSAYLAAFTRGIDRLNAEIVGPLTSVTFANQDVSNTCGATGVAPLNEQIGSLVIYVSVGPIDGTGGVIASSGPCYVRQSNKLTVVGTMLFDAADLPSLLSNGQLNDAIFHELQHVVGFGTLWTTVTPPLIVNAGTPQTGFTGSVGIHACQLAGGVASDCVPTVLLESAGGAGTADQHWRGNVFGNELMTALLPTPSTPKPFSAMSLGSITDLGYQTNPNVVDAYAVPSSPATASTALRLSRSGLSNWRDVVLRPRFTVTHAGVVSPIR